MIENQGLHQDTVRKRKMNYPSFLSLFFKSQRSCQMAKKKKKRALSVINGKDVPIQLHQLQLYWPKMLNDEKSYLKAFGIYSCMLYPGHRHIHNENSMQKKN